MSKILAGKIALFLFTLDLFFTYLAFYGNYAVINYRLSLGVSVNNFVFWLAALVLCGWLYREKMWILLAGGLANILSRFIWGGVVDYWSFFGLFYNNLADYMLFFGVVFYGYSYFVRRYRNRGDR